ncbi:MAG: hypothetical protein K2W96_02850 [Gemmataceae bacterium]|nr:hypothetical protein [Gemmataceae bacterium]
MARIGMLALALATMALAAEPEPAKTFRVYSVSPRGGRVLASSHGSAAEAFAAAEKLRAKGEVEVATGERAGSVPVLYGVYTKRGEAGWAKEFSFGDSRDAKGVAQSCRDKGGKAEIVADHAPKEVWQVFGGKTRKARRLLGSYARQWEAFEALERFRAEPLVCDLARGLPAGKPPAFGVFVKGAKSEWTLEGTFADRSKACEDANKRVDEGKDVEVVALHGE